MHCHLKATVSRDTNHFPPPRLHQPTCHARPANGRLLNGHSVSIGSHHGVGSGWLLGLVPLVLVAFVLLKESSSGFYDRF